MTAKGRHSAIRVAASVSSEDLRAGGSASFTNPCSIAVRRLGSGVIKTTDGIGRLSIVESEFRDMARTFCLESGGSGQVATALAARRGRGCRSFFEFATEIEDLAAPNQRSAPSEKAGRTWRTTPIDASIRGSSYVAEMR